MEIEILSKQVRDTILKKLDAILEFQTERNKKDLSRELIPNLDFIKMMKISSRTAQNWRDHGMIEFVKIGDKIYYERAAIERMLEKHKVRAFKG